MLLIASFSAVRRQWQSWVCRIMWRLFKRCWPRAGRMIFIHSIIWWMCCSGFRFTRPHVYTNLPQSSGKNASLTIHFDRHYITLNQISIAVLFGRCCIMRSVELSAYRSRLFRCVQPWVGWIAYELAGEPKTN